MPDQTKPTIRLFIEKFDREVIIEADHPDAVAQVAKNVADGAGSEAGGEEIVPETTESIREGVENLSRPELQALAKKYQIKANLPTAELVELLVSQITVLLPAK